MQSDKNLTSRPPSNDLQKVRILEQWLALLPHSKTILGSTSLCALEESSFFKDIFSQNEKEALTG